MDASSICWLIGGWCLGTLVVSALLTFVCESWLGSHSTEAVACTAILWPLAVVISLMFVPVFFGLWLGHYCFLVCGGKHD